MFKEILQIIPKLSNSDLTNMEKSLSGRFGKIAKKFGKGLIASLASGGVAGIALGLIDKLLNPLKETQEAIDRVLKQGDDIVTNAKQFGTTAGKLFRLQSLAKSTGLDESSLFTLIEKFQGAVAEATADKGKETSVRQFVGSTDMADAFFQFIQSLQKMSKTQQILVQQEVFGEKQILKMADFLQTDFAEQTKLVGGPTSEALTPKLENLGKLNDLKDALEAGRDLADVMKKGGAITEAMIKSQAVRAQLDLDKENQRLKSYENLAAISEASTRITNFVEQGVGMLGGLVAKVTDLSNNIRKISESRAVKGIMSLVGGK